MKKVIFLILSTLSLNAFGTIYCSNVEVRIDTSTTSSYHNFDDLGYSGSILFISVPSGQCSVSGGDSITGNLYFVLSDLDDLTGLKSLWVSILLSAEARGKTIDFNSSSAGVNSAGKQGLNPYRLMVSD